MSSRVRLTEVSAGGSVEGSGRQKDARIMILVLPRPRTRLVSWGWCAYGHLFIPLFPLWILRCASPDGQRPDDGHLSLVRSTVQAPVHAAVAVPCAARDGDTEGA